MNFEKFFLIFIHFLALLLNVTALDDPEGFNEPLYLEISELCSDYGFLKLSMIKSFLTPYQSCLERNDPATDWKDCFGRFGELPSVEELISKPDLCKNKRGNMQGLAFCLNRQLESYKDVNGRCILEGIVSFNITTKFSGGIKLENKKSEPSKSNSKSTRWDPEF